MGDEFITNTIFEIENKDKEMLVLYEDVGDGWRVRDLCIEDSNAEHFRINKTTARKLINALKEVFKIE